MSDFAVRRAGADDVAALVALRAAMFAAIGPDPGGADAPWRDAAADWFTERLPAADRFAAFLAEDPSGGVVSGACAGVDPHTPHPGNPGGVRAEVFNVCTLPGYEGRGLARGCVAAVLEWVREETTAGTVRLAATAAGSGIYRALGFTEADHPDMRLRLDR